MRIILLQLDSKNAFDKNHVGSQKQGLISDKMIEQKGMTFDHDYPYFFLLFSTKKREEKKENEQQKS